MTLIDHTRMDTVL